MHVISIDYYWLFIEIIESTSNKVTLKWKHSVVIVTLGYVNTPPHHQNPLEIQDQARCSLTWKIFCFYKHNGVPSIYNIYFGNHCSPH